MLSRHVPKKLNRSDCKLWWAVPIVLTCLVVSSLAQAAIYKCVSSDGKTHFQDSPCSDGVESEVSLGKTNTMDKQKRVEQYKESMGRGETNRKAKPKRKSALENHNEFLCKQARQAYEREAASIKERCKRGRETFCNKSPEEIQKIWDSNFLKREAGDAFTPPSRQWHAFNQNGGAPINNIKAQVEQYCR